MIIKQDLRLACCLLACVADAYGHGNLKIIHVDLTDTRQMCLTLTTQRRKVVVKVCGDVLGATLERGRLLPLDKSNCCMPTCALPTAADSGLCLYCVVRFSDVISALESPSFKVFMNKSSASALSSMSSISICVTRKLFLGMADTGRF